MKRILKYILIVCLVLAVIGLVLRLVLRDYEPRYNQPVSEAGPQPVTQSPDEPPGRGMWPDRPEQDDSALVMVAISGGGTRAAAVGWSALEALRGVKYRFTGADGNPVESNLANEIDLVAGISGGSFTATAWCLGGGEMERFRKRFIERDLERALAANFISMKGVLAFFSRRYSRIDWAAELYNSEVFDGKTFAALPARPLLRLHATNLALGQRFTFTRDTFAGLASELNSYPLGYACAASSAFPILLNPLTLRNYPPPLDLAADLTYLSDKQNAREDLGKDLRVKARDYFNNKSNQFIHLADGGLVDNQGLQSILDEFEDNGLINKRINFMQSPLRRLIIININAGVAPPNTSGESAAPPSIPSVVQSTMVSSMDVLSARRWMDIQTRCHQLFAAKIDVGGEVRSYGLLQEPYRIEISFRNILKPEDLQTAMKLPTSFKLKPEQLQFIDGVVPALLREDPEFQRLVTELAQ
ncbi:MAG TPA: patatin-like phospholipase family protein [Chthoniobacterales bacterium]|nr:patatin-like phospholipase family protein [Chthoniobacterales bacterium]